MRLFSDTQENISKLFEETGEYAGLCKQYAQKRLAEKIATLLSMVVIAVALFLLGSIVLLLLFFSLAYLLGNAIGSLPLGFACLSLIALALFLVVYWRRKSWITATVARGVNETICDTAAMAATAEETEQLMRMKGEMAMMRLRTLRTSTGKTYSKAQRTSRLVYQILSLYNGFRIGMSLFSVANGLFGGNKRKKK